mmetsp:Transcript_34615/g.62763  ORF Transcript_34615/g.62763 Transcript_34615/m.62763 type:complete len:209 (-) Transcript_34615:691-1317(-)
MSFLIFLTTKKPIVIDTIQYRSQAKISTGVGWSCQPSNARISTKNRLVLSLQQSVASHSLWLPQGLSDLGDQVPKTSSSCKACIEQEKKPAQMKRRNIDEPFMKLSTFIFEVPWKKHHPTTRDDTRARMMGNGSELKSLMSGTTAIKKPMDSMPSRMPVVKANTKKAYFCLKAASPFRSACCVACTLSWNICLNFRSCASLLRIILKN